MEMKNAFDGLIRKLDTAVGRINALEDTLLKTSKTEIQREKKNEKEQHITNCGTITKGRLYM
jgi:hypothetical protein